MAFEVLRRKLKACSNGNMSIFLAITTPVLLLSVGAAVDMTDTVNRKNYLQNATDNAVLAAAMSGETNISKLKKEATSAFNLNYKLRSKETLESFDIKLLSDGELNLQTKVNKPTSIMALFGRPKVDITTNAATYLPSQTPLDIALVLDRTGSMAGSNMAGLISASDDFIHELGRESRDVRISVIPFADYVNIGVDKASEIWLDMPSASGLGSNVLCTMQNASTSSCLSSGSTGSSSTSSSSSSSSSTSSTTTTSSTSSGCTTTTTTTSSGGSSSTSTTSNCTPSGGWGDISRTTSGGYCTISSDPQDNGGSLIEECEPARATENWFGCVGSRAAPNNAVADYSSGGKFPPIFDRTCGQPILELTDNLRDVRKHIESLTASGMTYIPSGLQWGWRSLTEEAPLSPRSTEGRKRLLILMTDGQNTRSQSANNHTGTDYAQADRFTLELCEAIKYSDITVATVAYSNGGSGSADSGLLSKCASNSGLHFSANDPEALLGAFSSATNQSSDVRLIR